MARGSIIKSLLPVPGTAAGGEPAGVPRAGFLFRLRRDTMTRFIEATRDHRALSSFQPLV